MIVGKIRSADGGFRRIPVRHTQIVDNETRCFLVSYIEEALYRECQKNGWVGYQELFKNYPEDILVTPLKIIYEICSEKFKGESQSIKNNTAKYIGMLVREAAYSSEEQYYEKFIGSARKYSLVSKELATFDFKENRREILEKLYQKKHVKL